MKKRNRILITAITLVLITIVNFSCQKDIAHNKAIPEEQSSANGNIPDDSGFAENNMVMYWNEKAALVLNVHTNPGADSRYFAIIEIAVHDALNSIIPRYERYALSEREKNANVNAAIASATYWSIKGLNIQKTFPLDTWYSESLATIPDGNEKELGKALGKRSADAIIANRINDGFNQIPLTTPLPLDGEYPGEYRVTLPFSNPDLNLPHVKILSNWGAMMRPFVVQSNYQFRPPGAYAVNSPEYTVDYDEVKSKGAMVGSTRTTEESQQARFWLDVRHHIVWNNFARKIIASKNIDAWRTARLFALIHTAMADGASALFEAKYHFYYWRPETAIRVADDGNPNTISDQSWLPSGLLTPQANPLMNIYTPRVPEYPSAFGILGGITGQILQSFFDSDEISIDVESATLPGITLHYSSIAKAVNENSVSKVFAGWYFRKASIDGEEMGKQIGNYIFTNAFREVE